MARGGNDPAAQAEPVDAGNAQTRTPRHRQTLSDTLSTGILNLARDQGLGPGDPMPNAKALAEHFDVATPTIREALRRLEATGSVELRHGSGIYVGANLSRILLPNPHADEASVEVLVQMLDARLLIEPNLARMAADKRLPDEQLDALNEALLISERHEPEAPPNPRTFHRQLARASGNTVMYECVDALLSIRWREQKMLRRLFDDRARDRDQHRQILEAVVAGNPEEAYERTRQHLEEIRSVVADGSNTARADPRAGAAEHS